MARIYRDDITGEEYDAESELEEFGIINDTGTYNSIDVATETVRNDPEKVASALHGMVDGWLSDTKQHFEEEAEWLTECHSCGYRWEYNGNKERATCPNCGNKTEVNNDR